MIASPRMRVPNQADLPDLIKRLKGENALIELDAKTKFKKQKDYVQVHLSQALPPSGSNAELKPKTIQFVQNVQADRNTLFPKLQVPTRQETDESSNISRLNSVATSHASEASECLVLAHAEALKKHTVKVFLPPFDGTAVDVMVDDTVTIARLVDALVHQQRLGRADPWCMRWSEDEDGTPDFDLPLLGSTQLVADLNASELCLCRDDLSDSD